MLSLLRNNSVYSQEEWAIKSTKETMQWKMKQHHGIINSLIMILNLCQAYQNQIKSQQRVLLKHKRVY